MDQFLLVAIPRDGRAGPLQHLSGDRTRSLNFKERPMLEIFGYRLVVFAVGVLVRVIVLAFD